MAIGIGIALILVAIILPRLPQASDRVVDLDLGVIDYKMGMGDLFFAQPHLVRPLDDPHEVIDSYRLAWDKDGFRVPAFVSDDYDILVLGDSYTEASTVALPYPDVLARLLNQPVRNLGFRGYGPVEILEIAQEFANGFDGHAIIIGFFGANDFANLERSAYGGGFELPRIQLTDQTILNVADAFDPNDTTDYIYPVNINVDGTSYDMAFLNGYLREHLMAKEDLQQSQAGNALVNTWQEIKEIVSEDTCIVIAYLPSRPEIYLERVIEADQRRMMFPLTERKVYDANSGWFQIVPDSSIRFNNVVDNLSSIREVVSQLARDNDFHFVDTTPDVMQASQTGDLLYYQYDTHPSQRGHDVMAESIANYLSSTDCLR